VRHGHDWHYHKQSPNKRICGYFCGGSDNKVSTMETTTKLGIGSSAAGILAIIAIVMNFGLVGEENVYACLDNEIAMKCDRLSAVNADGFQTRCYYEDEIENRTRYKNCKTGWLPYEPTKTGGISLNFSEEDPLYLVCTKTNPIISECRVIDSNKTLFKIEN